MLVWLFHYSKNKIAMNNKIIFAIVIALLSAPFSCKKVDVGHSSDCNYTATPNHPKAAIYQAVLDEYVANGLPGISALVRDASGTWAGAAGKADISENIDMKPCTVSKACSITKTFIGALTLQLVEEGKFSLDDTISKWLPTEIIDKVKNARESTVRMLMNHTTGIADIIDDNNFYLAVLNNPARKWKPADLIPYVYGDSPEFSPAGSDATYSNTNFLLLVMIIEKATGQPHDKLLREKVIAPLNLGSTSYYWHDALPPNTAQGYFDLYNNGTILNMTNYNTGSGNGYGGLYSNVYDLQIFIEALVRDKKLLSTPMLTQMLTFTQEVTDGNRENGLGIFRDFLELGPDEYAYGHRGRDLGYTADMYWFPEKDRTMVYFVNYGTDATSDLKEVFKAFRTAITKTVVVN
jgi:D-alanyl-D-alanine carboxypeptidase